jgi:hypothetical protein
MGPSTFDARLAMQAYAYGFLIAALSSACFIDAEATVARLGKWATGIFAALFVVTEAMAMMGR